MKPFNQGIGGLIDTRKLDIFFKIFNLIKPNLKKASNLPDPFLAIYRRGRGKKDRIEIDGITIPPGYRELFRKKDSIFSGATLQEIFDFRRDAENRSSDEEFSISTILEL